MRPLGRNDTLLATRDFRVLGRVSDEKGLMCLMPFFLSAPFLPTVGRDCDF